MVAADSGASVPPFRRPYIVTAGGRQALDHILRRLRLHQRDEVWIATTLGDRDLHVSPCVTATAARYCRFAFRPGPRTAAALVIHDYGVPHPELTAMRDRCLRHGWPLIEDAAHAFASTDSTGRRLGEDADFALFSLPKFFPLESGGLVMGLPPSAEGVADGAAAARLARLLPLTYAIAQLRRRNWQLLDDLFSQLGLRSALPLTAGAVPSLYLLQTTQQFSTLRRLRGVGVETGPDAHCNRLMLPCHQCLGPDDIHRIVAAVANDASTATAGELLEPAQTGRRPIWLTSGHR